MMLVMSIGLPVAILPGNSALTSGAGCPTLKRVYRGQAVHRRAARHRESGEVPMAVNQEQQANPHPIRDGLFQMSVQEAVVLQDGGQQPGT